MILSRLGLCLASLALAASLPAQQYTDQTVAAGLDVTHSVANDFNATFIMGGGAVADFNNDGWPDVFLIGGGLVPDRLFINQKNSTFVDEAASWGLTTLYRGSGASTGDFNGDGFVDIFVSSYGDMHSGPLGGWHKLWRNDGGTGFTNVAHSAGVAFTTLKPGGMGSAFGDYDLDGDLDLFVTSWEQSSQGNRLFRNDGNESFTDVTDAAGLLYTDFHGFTPRFVDMNGDRYPELLVAADYVTSRYFCNNRDGTFTEVLTTIDTAAVRNGMGSAVGDFDRNGLFDWYVTDIERVEPERGNQLFMNQGDHFFNRTPESAGVLDGDWGWGAVAIDVDHDGWEDIIETNGWPGLNPTDPSFVFINDQDGTFTDVAQTAGFIHNGLGRTLLPIDYDRDGDLDILLVANQEPCVFYEADAGMGNWLQITFDTSANPGIAPGGVGTRITATAGAVTQYRYHDAGPNFLGSGQPVVHFGLDTAAQVDELRVEWPDGFVTTLSNLAANQALTVAAPLPFAQTALSRGQQATLTLSGALPGETVYFAASPNAGDGPCTPKLGGRCLGLLQPITVIGTAAADASGVAQLSFTVPNSTPLIDIVTQAAIRRGPAGVDSALSNVIVAPVLP